MWHAVEAPHTQKGGGRVSSAGVCSLELAAAPTIGQKTGNPFQTGLYGPLSWAVNPVSF